MLILARYLQEAIFIGEAHVTILNIAYRKHSRARVTLGINASSEIPILCAELHRYQSHERAHTSLLSLKKNTKNDGQEVTTEKQKEAGA